MTPRFFLFVSFLVSSLDLQAGEHAVSAGYQSKYVTEGRDNLSSGGLLAIEYVYEAPVSLSIWHAESPDADYEESQVTLAATAPLGEVIEASVGWTAVSASSSGQRDNDHEISLTLAGSLGPWVSRVDAVWSHQEDGAWLSLEQSLALGAWGGAYLGVGTNHGYVGGESNGLNHVIAGVRGSVETTRGLRLEWDLAHTHAVRRQVGDSTINGTWGSVGLRYVF